MTQNFADFYESNLELLKKNHPIIYKQLTGNPPDPIGKIVSAPNGQPNLEVKNNQGDSILFHHAENPEKDSLDFLNNIAANHNGLVAILGMGLCYSALKILKERPKLQRLALFELEPGIFLQALKYVDLSSILDDPRLILSIGSENKVHETLAAAYRTLNFEDINIMHHRPSFNFNPTGYKKLKEEIFAHINSINVGGTTMMILGKDFMVNRFKNICTTHHNQLLENIQNRFLNTPAILVAGGPSLDKNIHLLKHIQEKAVIIAVDTVLPALLENGVRPHFLTCIDPLDLTFEKLADFAPQAKDIALITASWVNSKTPKVFPADQIFWTFTGKPFEIWLNSSVGGQLLTGGATTVAHLNLIAAHILGCDPIVFMGQDLAYPSSDSASHAKGTTLQGTAPIGMTNAQVQEQTVIGINGEILSTDRAFLSMKKHFESAIAKSSKTHINATEGGAHIEGTRVLPLKEVIESYCRKQIHTTQSLKEFYKTCLPISPQPMLAEFSKVLEGTKKLRKAVKKADDLGKTILNEVNKLKRKTKKFSKFDMFPMKLKKQITTLDKLHAQIDNEKKIWKILEEITMSGLKESERQKQQISVIEKNPDRYLDWLILNLSRLSNINKTRERTLALLEDNLHMVLSFHKKEKTYLDKIKRGPLKEQSQLKLVRHYVESKEYHLAKPILEELEAIMPNSGEVLFYLGCLYAQFNKDEKTEAYFEKAINCDPTLAERVDSFLQELSDEFLSSAIYFKTEPGRELSVKYLVKKGLKYKTDHAGLINELEVIIENDLKSIQPDVEANNYKTAPLITEWFDYLSSRNDISEQISKELTGSIFLYQGKLFLYQKEFNKALAALNSAKKFSSENQKIHAAMIDTLFSLGDFNGAIEALNNAIKLDKKFAGYWETIGDSLCSAGQNEDAIIAYEKCFMSLPENINLLKKIGDCYMAAGQLEAAKAAYQQLTLKLDGMAE